MSTDADAPPGSAPMRGGLLGDDALATARSGAVSFVRETVDRADAEGVVVGLSGGVDSTLTAILAVEALGSDRVVGLSLPRSETNRQDANEARTIAEGLGIEFHEVPLGELLDQFTDAVATTVSPETGEQRVASAPSEPPANAGARVDGNATARVRMTALYYTANVRSLLVLGTANRTELFTGYFTKYGDGGADLFPLGGLYKTEVRTLARRVGVPHRIVEKPSTAGFWAGQTDVKELGARYEEIDALLHRIVDEGAPFEATVEELSIQRSVAMDLLARCTDAGHKRRTPTIYPIGDRPTERVRLSAVPTDRDPVATIDARDVPVASSPDAPAASPSVSADDCDLRVDRDALFGALADERRRAILDVLYSRGETTSVPALATAVVERITDRPRSTVPPDRFEHVSAALAHVHLPYLAEADFVDYDARRRTVRLTDHGTRLRPLVEPLLA